MFVSGASAWGADRLGYLSPFAYAYTNGTSAMVSTRPSTFILCNLVNSMILLVKLCNLEATSTYLYICAPLYLRTEFS